MNQIVTVLEKESHGLTLHVYAMDPEVNECDAYSAQAKCTALIFVRSSSKAKWCVVNACIDWLLTQPARVCPGCPFITMMEIVFNDILADLKGELILPDPQKVLRKFHNA